MQWSSEEINILKVQVNKYGQLNKAPSWPRIARAVGRPKVGARDQANKLGLTQRRPYTHWSKGDKERLRILIQNNTVDGRIQWKHILESYPNRNYLTLSHYARRNGLTNHRRDKIVVVVEWNQSQLQLLRQLVNNYLSRKVSIDWNEIASHFENFTQSDCENAAKREKLIKYDQALWSLEEQQFLMKLVKQARQEQYKITREHWELISKQFVNRSATSCREQSYKLNQVIKFYQPKQYVSMTKEEQRDLLQFSYMRQNKEIDWKYVACKMKNYSALKCYQTANKNHFLSNIKYSLSLKEKKEFRKIIKESQIKGKIQWGQIQQKLTQVEMEKFGLNVWQLKQTAIQNYLVAFELFQ